jgi:hypothetical protein
VVDDPDLTLNEKRALLASWAADACALQAAPALKSQPPEGALVKFDDIVGALRELDDQAAHGSKPRPHYRRVLSRRARPSGRTAPLS